MTLTDIVRKKMLKECSSYLEAVIKMYPGEIKIELSDASKSKTSIEFSETVQVRSKPWIEEHQYWIRWHTMLASASKDYLLLIMGLSESE